MNFVELLNFQIAAIFGNTFIFTFDYSLPHPNKSKHQRNQIMLALLIATFPHIYGW
jgi:hypothetical protein